MSRFGSPTRSGSFSQVKAIAALDLRPVGRLQSQRLALLPVDLVLVEKDHALQILIGKLGHIGNRALVLLRRLAPAAAGLRPEDGRRLRPFGGGFW